MKTFHEGAYGLAAFSAVVATMRALITNGVVVREDAVRFLLDEAVSRAIAAEGSVNAQDDAFGRPAPELNRQSAELLKIVAESL